MLFLTRFFQHLFRLVVHLLSFRRSVFGHDCCSSWARIQGMRWRRGCSARTLLDSAMISYFFQSCNRLYRFSNKYCSHDIAVWKTFRKIRRSRCCSLRRSNPAILCWTCWSSASVSSPGGKIPCTGGSRTSRSTSWLCSRVLYSARLQKEVLQVFCGPRCCYRCPRNFSNGLMVPKMILRLGFVDLLWTNYIASSILARLVALSELSEPSGRAHPKFSYIPLSQCELQAVCCGRERLHVTVSGKIAIISLEQSSNCTTIQYFEGVSKYICMARSLVSPDRMELLPYPFVVKKTICLPLSIHYWLLNAFHLRSRRGRCTQ